MRFVTYSKPSTNSPANVLSNEPDSSPFLRFLSTFVLAEAAARKPASRNAYLRFVCPAFSSRGEWKRGLRRVG